MSKNSQRYYTTKRLTRDLLSNMPNCYVRGMHDRSMRSGMEFTWEIQLHVTGWSTANKPV